MSKFGIIYTAFNTEDYISDSLAPWIKLRKENPSNFYICAVNCRFKDFAIEEEDSTYTQLKELKERGEIDEIIRSEEPIHETEARGAALTKLIENNCDFSVIVDSDEFYQVVDIERIINFVEKNKFTASFKIPLKNYIFEGRTFLLEPFEPFRIHRLKYQSYVAHSFWDDNNIQYKGTITRDFKFDINLPYTAIPTSLVWIPHKTWMNDTRGKLKVFYQKARNFKCSYRWNEAEDKLEFNPDLPIPKVGRDSEV